MCLVAQVVMSVQQVPAPAIREQGTELSASRRSVVRGIGLR